MRGAECESKPASVTAKRSSFTSRCQSSLVIIETAMPFLFCYWIPVTITGCPFRIPHKVVLVCTRCTKSDTLARSLQYPEIIRTCMQMLVQL